MVFFTDPTSPAGYPGDPWVCVANPGENERGVTPPLGPTSVPCISFTECSPHHSSQPDPGDSGDGDYDDGPEYLAIGNLGSRRLSRNSTHSSDQSEPQDQSQKQECRILPPHRRSSFSEGQKGPGRGLRGHTRSFSDTGINAKLRSGKQVLITLKTSALSSFLLSRCALTLLSSPQTAAVMERHIIGFCLFLCGILFAMTIAFVLECGWFSVVLFFPGCKTKHFLEREWYSVRPLGPDGNSLFLIPWTLNSVHFEPEASQGFRKKQLSSLLTVFPQPVITFLLYFSLLCFHSVQSRGPPKNHHNNRGSCRRLAARFSCAPSWTSVFCPACGQTFSPPSHFQSHLQLMIS